jgi:hypothetical protein
MGYSTRYVFLDSTCLALFLQNNLFLVKFSVKKKFIIAFWNYFVKYFFV